ncbi:MAG: hypothetical protein LBD67_10920 [Candidatus Accumulibacter sp.]|nr:hypothetical protein [Accumulibacter sp.]
MERRLQKPKKIKNGLRTLFLSFVQFFAFRDERVKTPSAPSLPNHRQYLSPFVLSLPNHRHPLSPFVLSLSKYERTLQIINGLSNPYPSTGSGRSRVNRSERRRPSSPGHMPLFESKML